MENFDTFRVKSKESGKSKSSTGEDFDSTESVLDQLVKLPTSHENLAVLQDQLHKSYQKINKKEELLEEIGRIMIVPRDLLKEIELYKKEKKEVLKRLEKYIYIANSTLEFENIEEIEKNTEEIGKNINDVKTDLDGLIEEQKEYNEEKENVLKKIEEAKEELIEEIKVDEQKAKDDKESQTQENQEESPSLSKEEITIKRQEEWKMRDDKTEIRVEHVLAELDTEKAKIDIIKSKKSENIQLLDGFYKELEAYINALEKFSNSLESESEKVLKEAKQSLINRVEYLRSEQKSEIEKLKKADIVVEDFKALEHRKAKWEISEYVLEKEKEKAENLILQFEKMAGALGISLDEIEKRKEDAIKSLNNSNISSVPPPLPYRPNERPSSKPIEGTGNVKNLVSTFNGLTTPLNTVDGTRQRISKNSIKKRSLPLQDVVKGGIQKIEGKLNKLRELKKISLLKPKNKTKKKGL